MSVAHSIVLGDWGGDGHEKTKTYLFFTPAEFTDEVLAENYKKNVVELQVDPTTFCKEYEDNTLPDDVRTKLAEHGCVVREYPASNDQKYIGTDGMFQILMLLIGYGLEGFTWTLAESPKPLIGTSKALATGYEEVGYGLFI